MKRISKQALPLISRYIWLNAVTLPAPPSATCISQRPLNNEHRSHSSNGARHVATASAPAAASKKNTSHWRRRFLPAPLTLPPDLFQHCKSVEGRIQRITYYDADSHSIICTIKPTQPALDHNITVIGRVLYAPLVNERVVATGKFVRHPQVSRYASPSQTLAQCDLS